MILDLEPHEIITIKKGLIELPYKQVIDLLVKIEQQVAQQIPKQPAENEKKDGE